MGERGGVLFFFFKDVPSLEFMYLVFSRLQGESYHRRVSVVVFLAVRVTSVERR